MSAFEQMSLFNLKTEMKGVPGASEQISRMKYDQVPATREVAGDSFSGQAISYKWSVSGNKWWIPSKSYLRTRVEISRGDGTQLTVSDNLAPAMGTTACLFQSGEYRLGDKTLSRIADLMPQIDALENRLGKSGAWLDGMGASTNFWSDDFKVRQADVCSDGININNLTSGLGQASLTRVNLGFDAAGGAGNDRNAASYLNATGLITFAQNGGAALPADVRVQFPVGSYLQYTSIQGAVANDARYGKSLLVLAGGSATTIQVAPLSLGADVAVDGRTDFIKVIVPALATNDARKVKSFETIWQPPLSIFKYDGAIPSSKNELLLNPQTKSVYERAVVESLLGSGDKTPGLTAANFKVNIVSMILYVCTVEGPRCDDATFLLDLEQCRCQADVVGNSGFLQKQFDVSPSTVALTVAYQDGRAGTNTQCSASKFKSFNAAITSSTETSINRLFLQYSGVQYPSPDADPTLVNGTDFTAERYVQSQIYGGGFFSDAGPENINKWHNRGSYYHFQTLRDATDRSTRVQVNQAFEVGTDVVNCRVLLFDHSKQVARVQVQSGSVINVQVEDA